MQQSVICVWWEEEFEAMNFEGKWQEMSLKELIKNSKEIGNGRYYVEQPDSRGFSFTLVKENVSEEYLEGLTDWLSVQNYNDSQHLSMFIVKTK